MLLIKTYKLTVRSILPKVREIMARYFHLPWKQTPIHITRTEQVDDIPLLLAQMDKMNSAVLLDKHFPMHGNWQGLNLGQIVLVWLSWVFRFKAATHSRRMLPPIPF